MTKATLHGAEAQTADGKPRLVLASASAARRSLLEAAGVPFEVEKAAIDEDAVKMGFKAEQAPVEDVAVALAEIKARRVARRLADRLVIGAPTRCWLAKGCGSTSPPISTMPAPICRHCAARPMN